MAETETVAIAARPREPRALAGLDDVAAAISQQGAMLAEIRAALLAQGQEIARLNRALSAMRVSRGQEAAIHAAIRARAQALCAQEGIPGGERLLAAEIRRSVREATGCRAAGDIQAAQYDAVMAMIDGWMQRGAIRRARRAMESKKEELA